MKRPLRILGTLIVSSAFLAPQMLLPPQPALADKAGVCATPGKDGVASALSGAVNTYYPGSTASGTNITVGTARGGTAIQPGDLLLVIQMQGADIDATNTGTYGDGNSANNGATGLPANPANGYPSGNLNTNFTAGNFEYVVATSGVGTGGGTFTISTSLVNTYSNANFGTQGQRRFQVIRIPQYTSATLGGTVTALPWDGSTGGIVAMDVAGTLNMGGQTINVTGQGFRGGGGRQLSSGAGANTDVRTLASVNTNGAKAEGTAGTPQYVYNSATNGLTNTGVEGYPNGSNGRGAPGNAGGGGTDGRPSANDENSGGGGGSNGGVGGRGGNTWNSNLPYGGVGGAAFSPAAANRLVLGGGGGAGSTNNGTGTPGNGLASSGAAGGGSVLIRTGTIGTAGTITADGAAATLIPLNDASGGGGAGGSVLVISQNNSAAGLTINARGGQGGTNTGGGSPHGPGGGGSGGVVFASPGTSAQLTGGSAGTTTGGVFGGATGGTGLSAPVSVAPADATTSIAGATCVPQLTVTKTTSTPTSVVGGTATYTITAVNAANKASATQVNISDALPAGFTYASLGSVNLSGGATRPIVTTPSVGATNPSFGQFTIPGGGQVQITFTVNVGAGTAPGTYQNPATATYLDPARTTNTGTTTATYNPASSTGEDVTVSATVVTVSGTVFSDSDGSVTINGSDAGTNAGSVNLTVYAVDTAGNVVDKATVAANGIYSLANVPRNSSVTLRLSNNSTVAIGSPAPTSPSLPSNWVNTGENKNGTTETTTLGDIAVTTTTINILNQNFGIEQLPNTTDLNPAAQTNPGGTTTVQVPTLAGTDPEDGTLGTGQSFKIVTLPTNSTLYYNGIAVTAGQIISSYDPTKLTLDPNDGSLTVSFTYAAVDAAGKEDPTPATVSMPFTAPTADLRVTKTDGQTTTTPGSPISYTITITNNGPNSVTSLTLTDTLPASIQSPIFTPSTGIYNSSTGAWTGLNLASGQSITLTVNGTVSASSVGTITNTATVAPPSGTTDPTPANNTATDTTNVYAVSPQHIVINEVLYAQTGATLDGNDEFIELYNASAATVDLSDWKLADGNLIDNTTDGIGSLTGSSSNPAYIFPSGTTLSPGQYAVIWIGNNTADHQATGATFQTWLGQTPKLNNTGDDIWLYDAQMRIVDYVAYGSGSGINTPPPASLNLWNSTYQSSLAGASAGQSISLTPNGQDGNTSGCWERATSGQASGRCTGYLPTRDTDTVGSRVNSVGVNNNGTVATSPPNLLLVKRITAINGVDVTSIVDDPGSTNDNAVNWPLPLSSVNNISTYLRGAIDGGVVRPNDTLEYTIYFLSNGGSPATNVNLCDLVPANSTFIPNSFSSTPESGISLSLGTTATNLTNVPDGDGGEYFVPGAIPAVSCSTGNTNGAVMVRVVQSPANLPNATAPGTPNSYGFIRFRARVN